MKRAIVAAIGFCMILFLGGALGPEESLPDLKCKFSPPADMDRIPNSEVVERTRLANSSQITYAYGYRSHTTTTNYILVQPVKRKLFEDPKNEINEIRKSVPGGIADWDDKLKAITMEIHINGLHGRSWGFVGADQIVFLHCYAREGADAAAALPNFQAMADSFSFNTGYKYEDHTILTMPVIVGIVVVVGVVVLLIIVGMAKKGRA